LAFLRHKSAGKIVPAPFFSRASQLQTDQKTAEQNGSPQFVFDEVTCREQAVYNPFRMSILLIGYRGSGKTTLGRALAGELSCPFVDLDEQIVQRAGMSIKEIFQKHGEAGFRQWETGLLAEVLLLKDHVISLGGGAVLAEENRNAITKSRHLVIYLKATAEELHRRITADPTTAVQRPGLTHLGGSVEEVRELLAKREPIYQQMKTIELDVNSAPINELAKQLRMQLYR
jgi:shikimate kinase